jgi:polyhydroxyalkanoate synthesis repressor PhaR
MIESFPSAAAEPDVLDIRRYPNRRFYDANHSKTVTLSELHELVVGGHRIRVTETSTGEDITARVLTQIILDLDIGKLEMFPEGLLHAVLQANEGMMREFMDTHFHRALELFADSRKKFETQWKQSTSPIGEQDWMKAWINPFMPPADAPSAPESESLVDVVKDLSRQVAELQKQMSEQHESREGGR